MKNLLNSFHYIALLSAMFIVSGCDDKQSQTTRSAAEWQQEIQQRFDILNQMAGGVECIALAEIEDFPYRQNIRYLSSDASSILKSLADINLLTESIEEEPDSYFKDEIKTMYQYDLTDLGRQYFKKWPQLSYSGFCFGAITVTDITAVGKPSYGFGYKVNYDYTIDNVPDGIEQLIKSDSSYVAPETKNREITFRVDNNQRLYSNIGSSLIVHQAIRHNY